MPQRLMIICNKRGLHARATAKFVKVVAAHDVKISVEKAGQPPVCGSSILGLMMLGADLGSELTIDAQGPQADAVLDALETLIRDKFGEGE